MNKVISASIAAIALSITIAGAQMGLQSENNVSMMFNGDSSSMMKDFKKGDRGQFVKDLQQVLIKNGFLQKGNDTGYFGPMSEKAFGEFKKKNASTTRPMMGGDDRMKNFMASSTLTADQQVAMKAELDALATSTVTSCAATMQNHETAMFAIMKKYNPNFVAPTNMPADRFVMQCRGLVNDNRGKEGDMKMMNNQNQYQDR